MTEDYAIIIYEVNADNVQVNNEIMRVHNK